MTRFRFIRAHREAIGIIMISLGWGYFLFSILAFHGWLWLDRSYPWNYYMTDATYAAMIKQLWYMNYVAFSLFVLSFIVFIIGLIIYKPGDGPVSP
jgi:hypothetical protein